MAVMAIHPGEHLAEELTALDMSAAELARKISVPTNRVTQTLNGTRSVTGDTALRLGHFFGTSPQFWLNADPLRCANRGTESGKSNSEPPKAEAQRARARLNGRSRCPLPFPGIQRPLPFPNSQNGTKILLTGANQMV
jgi:addiction module HigA family antidote